jgi:18S rRNA (guanine1575-N7)-methyltransferase
MWIGCDISRDMLNVGREREECIGDTMNLDMGTGVPFRPGVFDGAISISAIQWLCYSNNKLHDPRKRLVVFFQSLYSSLKRGGKAALQFYPENEDQIALITDAAMRCGFTGGVLVDFPLSTKAKEVLPGFDGWSRLEDDYAQTTWC